MNDEQKQIQMHMQQMVRARNVVLVGSLAALSIGCFLERPSLALIVPSVALLLIMAIPYFMQPRSEK